MYHLSTMNCNELQHNVQYARYTVQCTLCKATHDNTLHYNTLQHNMLQYDMI